MSINEAMHIVAAWLNDGEICWRECADYGAPDDTFEWYYAKNGVYVIRHKKLKCCNFIKARSPEDAFYKLKGLYLSSDYGAPDDTFEWHYAENGLYVIRHKKLKCCNFIKARSPEDAFNKLKGLYLS